MSSVSEEIDYFDQLPDPILLSIFNKVKDAKSLCSSMAVCKRFNSIIPEIDNISLSIPPRHKKINPTKKSLEQRNSFNRSFIRRVILKPLNFLLQLFKYRSCSCDSEEGGYSYYLPQEILNPFRDLKSMEIKLPKSKGELGSDLLKWKAEFGSQFQSCVLAGAKSISRNQSEIMENQDLRIGDAELKLRIVWTISCLIAASARHYLIQQTLKDRENLKNLTIGDESNQGTLSMNSEQIQDLRKSINSGMKNEEMLLDRTKVPALRMKMWYVPELKLPDSDSVMKGATLVVIKPVDEGKKKAEESEDWVVKAIDGGEGEEGKTFVEAVKKLMKKKRSYTLEMNSF
ncbi:hypothetical protein M9H77_18279 [Catharanthus roseus]|uniref:Uncharacterized protein n=1 Tax=Catharanthus roseus TaxID=4058 RepID=A0ACC0B719_CATRO|nr:hypothetical protein M9H77_18279 [Catharanthus roseus]